MWIICGAISIIFCIGGWILKIKESDRAVLSAVCSLAFVIATLLVQYKMALNFKNLQPISEIMLCITGVIFISALFF